MNRELNTVVVSLGSNYGDRRGNVSKALDWFKLSFSDCEASDIYETPEIHGIGSPYMNAVCVCKVACERTELEAALKQYEKDNGRDASARARGDVPVDIDIVIWNGEVVRPKDFACNFFRIGLRTLQCGDKDRFLLPSISHWESPLR